MARWHSRITTSRVLMLMAALVVQIVLWTVLSAIDTKTGQWHWPTFIRWYTAKSIGGAIAVNLILSVGMTFVIIGGGIDRRSVALSP